MVAISAKRQLYFLFSFYFFANVLGSLLSSILLPSVPSQLSKLSLSGLSILNFLIPALIAYRLFSSVPLQAYWKLNASGSIRTFITTLVLTGCCIILMNWLAKVNAQIPLLDWMKETEDTSVAKLKQYLVMDSLDQLFLNLLLFAVIPAFCEEVFFRATMQPLFVKWLISPWIAIFITAFIFSFLHFQFSGFLPRLLAGILFGALFYSTGSLWWSVVSHALYNGAIVVLNYSNQHGLIHTTSLEELLLNPFLLLIAGFTLLFWCYRAASRVEPSQINHDAG